MISFAEYAKNMFPILYTHVANNMSDHVDVRWHIFTNVDFNGVKLSNISFSHCEFDKCNFNGLTLDKVVFMCCSFHDMQVKNITGMYAFEGCDSKNFVYDYVCPKTGSFTAYKKVIIPQGDLEPDREVVLTLQIPEDALRSSALGSSKCRASKVKVLSAVEIIPDSFFGRFYPSYMLKEIKDDGVFCSITRPSFTYKIGEEYEIDDFDKEQLHECAPGIHFFMDMNKATTYGWDYQ